MFWFCWGNIADHASVDISLLSYKILNVLADYLSDSQYFLQKPQKLQPRYSRCTDSTET